MEICRMVNSGHSLEDCLSLSSGKSNEDSLERLVMLVDLFKWIELILGSCFRYAATKAVTLSTIATAFPFFDIPVFWPILLVCKSGLSFLLILPSLMLLPNQISASYSSSQWEDKLVIWESISKFIQSSWFLGILSMLFLPIDTYHSILVRKQASVEMEQEERFRIQH